MLFGPTLVVALGVCIVLARVTANRTPVAAPVLLLVAGALVALLPMFSNLELPADAVLLLFLPALLYWESLTTSLREIRRNLRGVILMGTLLVVVTAACTAAVLHLLGVDWGPAWVIGAAVAPTDATAVGSFIRNLPLRNQTVLRAESLINDGTTLVVYGIAVGVTAGEQQLTVPSVAGNLAVSYVGGIVAGLLAAAAGILVLQRVHDHTVEGTVTLLVPFTGFLLAETVSASGVLAVVVAGLVISRAGPKLAQAATRQQIRGFWSFGMFLLNGSLFALVGIEAMNAARALSVAELSTASGLVLVITVVLILTRFGFQFAAVGAIWVITRFTGGQPRENNRDRLVSGFAGFRGAVSLAAAVAVPRLTADGSAFPDRDLIVFVTAGVVVVTILTQSIVLPAVTKRISLNGGTDIDEERRSAEETITRRALTELPRLAEQTEATSEVTDHLETQLRAHLDVLQPEDADGGDAQQTSQAHLRLRLAIIHQQRTELFRLRDEDRIDDTVLRDLQQLLDDDETRMRAQGSSNS